MPSAIVAACVPETPPPRTTTSAAGTPGTPPSRMPRPPCAFSSACAPTCGARRPATSDIGVSKRQAAVGRGHRLVGDAGRAAGDEILGLREIGREMQIGVQDLAAAKLLALGAERLLDLHDHFRAREDLLRRVDERRRRPRHIRRRKAPIRRPPIFRPAPSGRGASSSATEAGRQPDAKLVVLDFLGHADKHRILPSMKAVSSCGLEEISLRNKDAAAGARHDMRIISRSEKDYAN